MPEENCFSPVAGIRFISTKQWNCPFLCGGCFSPVAGIRFISTPNFLAFKLPERILEFQSRCRDSLHFNAEFLSNSLPRTREVSVPLPGFASFQPRALKGALGMGFGLCFGKAPLVHKNHNLK